MYHTRGLWIVHSITYSRAKTEWLKLQYVCEWKQIQKLPEEDQCPVKEIDANNPRDRGQVLGRGDSSAKEMLRANQKNSQDLRGEEGRRLYSRWDSSMCKVLWLEETRYTSIKIHAIEMLMWRDWRGGKGADHTTFWGWGSGALPISTIFPFSQEAEI